MLFATYLKSSIGKKQIVAVTGLMLILFITGHLAGNLFIYGGPDAYNHYAAKLAGLRPGLLIVEFGLAVVFVIHMLVTALLVLQNRAARGRGYTTFRPKGERSLAAKVMPLTGSLLLAFVLWHLLDFTFTDHHGARSMIDGASQGLYGVVYNSFTNPFHSLFYVLAMFSLGFHLYHGVESFVQTLGWQHPVWAPVVRNLSYTFSILVAFAYSTIPIYILLHHHLQQAYH